MHSIVSLGSRNRIRSAISTRYCGNAIGLLPCASRLAYQQCTTCITEDKCRLHRVMLMVRDETARILDGLTLADPVPFDHLPVESEAELEPQS